MDREKYNFQKLTPINTANIEIYEDAIDFVFDNNDLKNVALSGAYSAGKSSILETYKRKHQDKKFLHISLAHFESMDTAIDTSMQNNNDTSTKDAKKTQDKDDINDSINGAPLVKESVLEGKILNQLIHQIHPKRIPQTNFRVKRRVSNLKLASISLLFVMLSLALIYTFFFKAWNDYVNGFSSGQIKEILMKTTRNDFRLICGVFCILAIIILVYILIQMQINKGVVKRLGTDKLEIEIFEKCDDSYFDKYLNEVLYLFDRSKADVIVFEDMDRYNVNRIFERLREVNTLINVKRCKQAENKLIRKFIHLINNIIRKLKHIPEIKPLKWAINKVNSLTKKSNSRMKSQRRKKTKRTYKPLRFFYLLNDDIFVSKDRTKFFDYIIPIVPVVDSSNSYEQFLKHLKEGNLLDKFDHGFLQSLSLYVDDMRILKNIYNEFVVYIHRLNTTDLDWNKMMAMIAYKNLFPRDFCDLQLAKGFVLALFEQKQQLIEEALKSAKERRQDMLVRIEWAKKETMKSKQELDDAYTAMNNRLPRNPYNTSTLTEESQKMKKQYDAELIRRKQAVQDNSDGIMQNLESELAEIEHDIDLTKTKSLKDFITRENIDVIFAVSHTNEIGKVNEFKEIKGSDYFDLLKFLVRSGYIDETYADYMTYFYEDSISANDKTFLRRITDKRGAEYTYILKEPKKVMESPVLRAVEFEQEEALNFDIMECLLLNDSELKYATYLKTLISQIRQTKNFGFISKFYDTGKAHKQFVKRINEQWSGFFYLALQGKTIPSSQIRKFSIDTFYFSDEGVITEVNIDNCLTEYVSNSPDYLSVEQPDIDRLVSGFSLIGVLFITIDYDKSDKSLFEEVYRNSLYTITFENIALMLRKKYGIENDSDIVHKNYTLIQSNECSPLAVYISENMPAYTEITFIHCNGYISDDELVAISLLNNSNVENAAKKRYIELLSTIINEITQVIDPDLWTVIISRGILAFSEVNFINYFLKYGIDTTLIEYINNSTSEVDFTHTADVFGKETAEELFDEVALCNGISTDKYKKILVDLGYCFDSYEADEISNEKLQILISEGILQMDTDSLEFVREKYGNHIYAFIHQNFEKYLELQTSEMFRLDEALQIITWDVDDNQKTRLLAFTNEQISIVGKRYTDVVNAFIITHNIKTEDKQHLYSHYMQYGEKAQMAIAILAIKGLTEIITNNLRVDDNLLSVLLQSDAVTRDHKIMLFMMAIPLLNEETCKIHLDELELSDLKGIFAKGSGRRNYEKSKDVTTILDTLKMNGWFYDYHDDERNNDRYIIIKNKPRGKEPEILD